MEKSNQDENNCDIIQVVNICPQVTLEQITTLFGQIDGIDQIKLYSVVKDIYNFGVCYIKFANPSSSKIAKHLTNVVFIDRPLFVLDYQCDTIPSEEDNLKLFDEYAKYASIFNQDVISYVVTGAGGIQMFATSDPKLAQNNVAPYPNLPLTTDPSKIEEIRRTLYIGNLDSSVPVDKVMEFFSNIGEVKYIRLAGNENQPTRFAFVEYYNQASIANALVNNGTILGTKTLKINHSNNAIVKILHQPKLLPATMEDSRNVKNNDDSRYARDARSDHHHQDRSRSRDQQNHSSRDRDSLNRGSGGGTSRDRTRDRDRDRDEYYRHKGSSRDRDRVRHRHELVKGYGDERVRDRDRDRDRHRDSSRDESRSRYSGRDNKGRGDRMDREWNRDRIRSHRSRSRSKSRDDESRKRHRKHSPTRHSKQR